MAGILDFLQQPDAQLGIGLLAAGGPTTDPNQTGFGQRLAGAMNNVTANQQIALRAKLMQSQIDENAVQNQMRQAQMADAQRKQAMLAQWAAGGGGAAPMGGGAVGGGGGMAPAGAGPDFSPATLARLKLAGIDMTDVAKLAQPNWQNINGNLVNTNDPNFKGGIQDGVFASSDGRINMLRKNPDGSFVSGAPQGALETFRAGEDAKNQSAASQKTIKVWNPATQQYDYQTEANVAARANGGGRTGNPLIDAVMQTESNGNPNAVSPKGAQGLMQVMPGTNTSPGFGVSPARDGSEAERTRVGQEYLGKMKERYGGNDTLAAIAYNWGPGNTDMWLKSGGDFSKLPAETKNYVSAVMTRSAVNGFGGRGGAATQGNFAAEPSQNEAASAAGRQATASSIGGKAGELLKESSDAANSATQSVASAQRMVQALDSNKVLTGPTASLRLKGLQIASVLGMQGKDDAEKIANTRQAVQEMAKLTLEGRKQMSGQGAITNQESALAEKATSGSIDDLTAPEIRQLAQAAERTGRWKYAQHEAKMNAMSQDPAMAGNVALYKAAPMPDAISSPSSEKPASKPPIPMKGMVQDGYKFKGGNPADPTSWERT